MSAYDKKYRIYRSWWGYRNCGDRGNFADAEEGLRRAAGDRETLGRAGSRPRGAGGCSEQSLAAFEGLVSLDFGTELTPFFINGIF